MLIHFERSSSISISVKWNEHCYLNSRRANSRTFEWKLLFTNKLNIVVCFFVWMIKSVSGTCFKWLCIIFSQWLFIIEAHPSMQLTNRIWHGEASVDSFPHIFQSQKWYVVCCVCDELAHRSTITAARHETDDSWEEEMWKTVNVAPYPSYAYESKR